MSDGPVKRIARWMLLIDSTAAAAISSLTVLKCPVWAHWVTGMVVPEIALWVIPVPVLFAIAAWMLRRNHRAIATATIALAAFAVMLLSKPAVQAWSLGRHLPAQLEAAFGPASPARKPFSLAAAIVPRAPRPVAISTFEYRRGLSLDLYPAASRSPAPCVIVIHGGSWVSGNRLDDGTTRWLNDDLAARGFAVVSIDYRLCPEFIWPAQRQDLLDAIAYVKSHAAELGIDPTRLVLLGRSAGAQMATATAYAVHDPAIRGIVAIYPPTDFRLTWNVATKPGNLDHRQNLIWFLGGTPDSASAAYESASGALLAGPGAPPTLILQGRLDINVFHRQAELLDEKLSAALVPHALVSLPWAAHAFDFVNFNTPGAQIGAYAVEWFVEAMTR